ncbi:related to protein ste16 [Serendipita indica DSM 11827]|uniref:Related to protein ste16 n=1 Tax=Serendipita indica (strain DSM 11827) TaxID=1109443 RepID=G4TRF3_SERID|nr:related to protein ste16 [Serendipita indica DSM 11827]
MASTITALNVNAVKTIRNGREHDSTAPAESSQEWPELAGLDVSKQLERLNEMLLKETKVRDGAERMLEERTIGPLRRQVEAQLDASNTEIKRIQRKIDQIRDHSLPSGSSRNHPNHPNRNANKRKATAGLTFLNGTGLATPSNTHTPGSSSYASTSPRPPTAPSLNSVSDGASIGPSATESSAAKRFFAPSLVPQPPTRTRSESEAAENKDDYKTALSQARGLIRTLSSLATSSESQRAWPGTGGTGDRSPPYTSQRAISSSTSLGTSSGSPKADAMSDAEIEQVRMELMAGLVQILLRNKRVRWEIDIREVLHGILPLLSDNVSQTMRVAAYRLLRYVMAHPDGPSMFSSFEGKDLGWFIVRSLCRDNKHVAEKEQVFLLIRALIDAGAERRPLNVPAGCFSVPIKENVVRAVIAIAEQEEDTNVLRWPAVEMITEIFLLDAELIHRCEGIRLLLQTMAEGPPELSPILAHAFLTIIDNPRTRVLLKAGSDLEIALSGITDAYGKAETHIETMKTSGRLVVTLLRSWSGLLYLCCNGMQSIKALVDTLRIPGMDTREVVLDLFFDILNIKPAEWYRTFLDGRRLTMYGRQRHANSSQEQAGVVPEVNKLTLIDQYLALVLTVLAEAGLVDALISMIEEFPGSISNMARKATLLLGEILQTANRLLPLAQAARMQSLPKLFSLSSDFQSGNNRMIGTSTLASIDSFNRNRSRLQPNATSGTRNRANSVDDPMRRGQRQIEQVKLKMAMQLDDRTFQLMLVETQVTITKDHTKWNFEILIELFEGPFLSGKRVDDGIRANKFGRRLMAFWHPSARRFCDLRKTKSNMKWVKLGCLILSTLVKTSEGTKFLLSEDDFLKDLSDSFAQFDPWNGNPTYDSIFTQDRVEDTLSFGYLQMLGQLSKSQRGMELMEHFKFFNSFYHLSDLKFREDLIKGIIENLDYSVDGHPRIVLSKALTSSYKHIRLYSTEYLGNLILNIKQSNVWMLRLLLTQLYDPAMEVRELAVRFLEEACETQDTLNVVVDMQPTLDHLGELGHPLLLRFMSTAAGFQYLYETGYIEREMDAWFHDRNHQYVVLVEVYLSQAFSIDPAEDGEDLLEFDGIAPPHFYGEMVKTELGCQVLSDKGHFSDFTHFIRQHGFDSDDSDIVLRLKSVLWAVGNIGTSDRGIPFLEDDEIIPVIIEIMETTPVLSIRGTCFFVIGLIASTEQGAEILSDYGWLATTSSLGQPTGICIPTDIEKFILIPSWEVPHPKDDDRRLPPLKHQHERDILDAIENLCNTVVANAASRTLAKLKSRPDTRHLFSSTQLLQRALHIISTRRYRFPVRKYVLELFDIKFDGSTLEDIAHYETQALEEVASNGGIIAFQRSHAHHAHGSRRSRHSMKAKSKRRSNIGQDDDNTTVPSSPVILRPKSNPVKVVGFDLPTEATLASAMLMQAD